ncbi:50S ribosomal protein L4 [Candidatus Woesearchaeota archaeon]|nr:50S ribosomal protein L4 [Candidatus Woesearchaeota archaeon]
MSISNTEVGTVSLPQQFEEELRPDLIKRAVLAVQSNRRQRYGAYPEAGMQTSAKLSRRRRDYKGSYGHGISRVPRKIMSHSGTQFNWVGAFAPGTVKGRRAHPPKAEKSWAKYINTKERKKAIRSALAATVMPNVVAERGHHLPEHYPFVVEDKLEDMAKTKEVVAVLASLGFSQELARASQRKVRAGKGTMRGRKYRTKKGLLVVVGKSCPLRNAAKNIPGLDVALVHRLNAELLAPGTACGRVTLYTKSAIEALRKERLYL